MASDRTINLTVHGIGPVGHELEPGEDRTWVSEAQFTAVLDAVAGRSDVRITFDDGNASDLEIALPLLVERGLRAEFFLLAGRLGEPGRLTADGVRALAAAGMAVGSHGWAHRDWRRLDDTTARQELHDAPAVLTDLVGCPVDRVAVPYGSYDRTVLRRLKAAGATRVYTSDGGPAHGTGWLQPRTSLHHRLDRSWIDHVLAGSPGRRVAARRTVAKLVKRWR